MGTPHYMIVSSVFLAHLFIYPSFNIIELEHFSHSKKGKIHFCFLRRKWESLSPMKTGSSGSHNLTMSTWNWGNEPDYVFSST